MLGFLLSQAPLKRGTFRRTSVNSLCDCLDGGWLPHISVCQNSPKADCDTTIYYLGVLILKDNLSPSCGAKYTIRLWLIFGGFVVGVDLPVIWLITLLNRLRGGIAILGGGCGRASLRVGSGLRCLVVRWVGRIKSS